jgi:hypothetical protein
MTASWETAVVTGCSEVLERIAWTHGIELESLSVAAAAKTPFARTVSIAVAGASSFRARLLFRATRRSAGIKRACRINPGLSHRSIALMGNEVNDDRAPNPVLLRDGSAELG